MIYSLLSKVYAKLGEVKLTVTEWLVTSGAVALAFLLFLLHLKDQALFKAETQVLEDQVSKKEDEDQVAVDKAKKDLKDAEDGA